MKRAGLYLYIIQILLSLAIIGCGLRQVRQEPPTQKFWHDCQETIPANPDGFQHFVCTDVKEKHWEVLVRREGK